MNVLTYMWFSIKRVTKLAVAKVSYLSRIPAIMWMSHGDQHKTVSPRAVKALITNAWL